VKKAKAGKSSAELAREHTQKTGKKISDRTVRRALHGSGLAYMKKRRKQRLTAANKAKRVQYAKDMTGYDWSKVLWTDETVFYLGSVQTKGWQDPEHPEEIELTRFPPKINVWGGIGYYFKTKLFFTTENINSARYIKILKARLPPNYVADCPRRCRGDWIFMQDGATAHTSKASVA